MTSDQWDSLSGWFNAWLEADLPERARLRAALADERPDLVAEADGLTGASTTLPGFLEMPALVLAARELGCDHDLLDAGNMVGPYRVVSFLARGGMGEVYRALDTRLQREVALKVLAESRTGDSQRIARFLHEARVTASLDHPNVVRVYDVGSVDDRTYLVAELLEGETLRTRIEQSSMAIEDVVRIGIEIAKGLGAAHAAGLVHRDLKPENVFLTRAGTTKILDFGIAKLAQDETVRDGFSTLTGVVLGTAGYLAPEQIRGRRVDARADLFALGAVLFEMLTRTRAFAREHIVETLHAILHDRPPDLLRDRRDLPPALCALVLRLLEKRVGARVQSSGEVIDALEHLDLTAIAGGTASSSSLAPRERSTDREALTLAVMPFRSIPAGSGSTLLELGLADVFITRLSQLSEIRVLPLTATERVRDDDPREAARRLGADRVLTVTLQRDSGLVRAGVQLLSADDDRTVWATTVDTDASSVFSIQDIIVTRVIEELAPQLTAGIRRKIAQPGTRNNDAYEAYLLGRVHVTRPTTADLSRAAGCFETAVRLDPEYADAWAGAASAYKRIPVVFGGQSGEAFARARAAATRALELNPDHAEALAVLGTVAFWHDWDYPRSEELLRRALALQPSSSDSQIFLAHLFSSTGRHDEALEEIRRSRALDPAWPLPRAQEGQFLFHARRYGDAIAHLNAMVEVEPRFWLGHMFRALTLLALHQYDLAIRAFECTLEIRGEFDTSRRPFSWAVALIGYAHARMGRVAEVERVLDDLRSRPPGEYVPPHHEALILHALGRDEEALGRLHASVDNRDVSVTFLGVDPKWDALRAEPAFRTLLARVNLLDVSDRIPR